METDNLASADPIYRFSWKTDVVRSRTDLEGDPLHGLVWGRPFARLSKRRYHGGRVWYIVEFPQEEVSRLYVRTVREFPIKPEGLLTAADTIEKLRDAIRRQYDEKDPTGEYERIDRFVAWTVFEKAYLPDVKKLHRGQSGRQSRGAGVTLDTRRGFQVVRQPTEWEKFQVYKMDFESAKKSKRARGVGFTLPRFSGPKQFQAWLRRLPPKKRREIQSYFVDQVRRKAREIERRRRL
jgi:hypothetical protein